MKRRSFLAATGAGTTALLAGCSALRGDRESAAVIRLLRNDDLFAAVWDEGDSIWDHL